MSLASAWSVALVGVDGVLVEIEADFGQGLPKVQIVGLPDAALNQGRDRVRAAVVNSGEDWPNKKLTIALSPASLPKTGSGYDLALAAAVLAADGKIKADRLRDLVLLGELALDGRVRPTAGVLPAVLAARRAGIGRVVVPVPGVPEAALVDGVEVRGARTLGGLLAWLREEGDDLVRPAPHRVPDPPQVADLADVLGQPEARLAVEVAAAGGHHLLMVGPPGTGKTMLAHRMAGVLPPLGRADALEVTAIHSVAGLLRPDSPLLTRPPVVAPHHTSSLAALVGGGTGLARPGAISRAHKGILFLDEVPEFTPAVLEALRTPLEEGEVRLARRDGVVRYPARCQLVMAANPCPCAPPADRDCICAPAARHRYLSRLSGPLMDRVDLRVRLRPVTVMDRTDAEPECTATVAARVLAAREAAGERWAGSGWLTNAEVPGPALHREFALPRATTAPLDSALHKGMITARGLDRCLRVAWTLADLAGRAVPSLDDVAGAYGFRRQATW